MYVRLLSFKFMPSMTCHTYRNHSLANYQYVKSTAVTLGASRATGSHAQCAGRLIIKTAVEQIDVVSCRLFPLKNPISPNSMFSQLKKKKKAN